MFRSYLGNLSARLLNFSMISKLEILFSDLMFIMDFLILSFYSPFLSCFSLFSVILLCHSFLFRLSFSVSTFSLSFVLFRLSLSISSLYLFFPLFFFCLILLCLVSLASPFFCLLFSRSVSFSFFPFSRCFLSFPFCLAFLFSVFFLSLVPFFSLSFLFCML